VTAGRQARPVVASAPAEYGDELSGENLYFCNVN
jgi:hypothetical protein